MTMRSWACAQVGGVLAAVAVAACNAGTGATSDASPSAVPDALVSDARVDAPSSDARVDAPSSDARVDAPPGPSAHMFVSTYLGGLLAFDADPDSGALTPAAAATIDPHAHLYSIALGPGRDRVYTVDIDRDHVTGYRVARDGALTPVSTAPAATGDQPEAIAIDPRGRFVFVGNTGAQTIGVYRADPDTGALTEVEHSPFAVAPAVFLAVHPAGSFLYATQLGAGIRVFAIDDTSGALTEIDGSPFGGADVGGGALVFSPDGAFLYNGGGKLNGFAVDATTGALTALRGSPFAPDVRSDPFAIDLALAPDGRTLVAITDRVDGHISAFHVDATSGALTPLGAPIASGPMPYAVAIDPTGRFVYVGNDDEGTISGFALDAATGAAHAIAGSPFHADGLQPQIVVAAP
jgi:6-phosphogluconolactonase (cycloisomerase 2 family)